MRPDRLLCRERHRNAGAQGLAPERKPRGRIPGRSKRVGGQGIVDETFLGWPSARSAVAAVAQRDQPGAVRGKRLEAVHAPAERTAVAVEIEHHRLFSARRNVPDDHALATGAVEHDLLSFGQARGSRRGARALGEILQRTLAEINQEKQAAISDDHNDEEPFEHGWGLRVTSARHLVRVCGRSSKHRRSDLIRLSLNKACPGLLDAPPEAGHDNTEANHSALTISSVIFLASPNSIMVLSR